MNDLYLTYDNAVTAESLYHPWRYADADILIDDGLQGWYEGDDIENLLEAGLTLCGI